MLRVYLDQNHWISLTKARVGHKDGERFTDELVLLREGVERGWVSLPLSLEHVMEVQHRSNWQSRTDLATTMIELSRWHAIGPQRHLLAAEIDAALRAIFGRPAVPRRAQVFGVGMDHVYGRPVTSYEPPAEIPIPPELLNPIRRFGREFKQIAALVGAPSDFTAPGYDPTAHRRVGEGFAKEQEELRAVRRPHGFHRGDLGRRATSVDVFGEFESSFTEALKLAGLHWGNIYGLEREGMGGLLESVPTVFSHLELRRLRHEASPKPWEEGDLGDLTALAPAIVYCNVVVTERVWTDIAGRAKLGERFGTIVLRDLKGLVPHLIGAAQAA